VKGSLISKTKTVLLALAFGQIVLSPFAQSCPCAFDPAGPYTNAANAAMQSGNYAGALSYLQQALKFDKENPNIIYNIALMYLATGNYREAEANMIKSIDVLSSNYGVAHRQVAQGYMDLGDLYENESTDSKNPELKKKTEECYMKSIGLCEEIYSDVSGAKVPIHSAKANSSKHKSKKICEIDVRQAQIDLSNVLRHAAEFYSTDDNFSKAEPLFSRSLELEQRASGSDDKDVCKHKAALAEFYCEASKPQLAEPLFKEVLASLEKNDQVNSRAGAQVFYNFGNLYRDQDRFADAEILLKRSVGILGKLTPDEMDLAEKSVALADVLDKQGKGAEAGNVCENALMKLEKTDSKQALMVVLKQYHKHFLVLHNKVEADKIAIRIKDLAATKPGAQ
jgi:tetratricopeptide (TPR) repeat protein